MATKQKMRPPSQTPRRSSLMLDEAKHDLAYTTPDRKVNSWLFDDRSEAAYGDSMDVDTDVFRGNKRRAPVEENVHDPDAILYETPTRRGHSSKKRKHKHKQSPSLPKHRSSVPKKETKERRTTSRGGNRDENVPDDYGPPTFRKYDVIEISDSEDEAIVISGDSSEGPATPTPMGRKQKAPTSSQKKPRNDPFSSIRQDFISKYGAPASWQTHKPGESNQRPSKRHHQSPENPEHSHQGTVQELPFTPLRFGQQPSEQPTHQTVHQQPESPPQSFTPSWFLSPQQIQNLSLSSPAQDQIVVRPKPKATPKKKSRTISSSLAENFFFTGLPLEIRERILRHLLVSTKPIQVNNLFTNVTRPMLRRARRSRGQQRDNDDDDEDDATIDARFLSVNRQAHVEGARILYSENIFHYKLRDSDAVPSYALTPPTGPSASNPRSSRRAPGAHEAWHTQWLDSKAPGPINFRLYAPFLRHIRIELEPNRSTDEQYEHLLICALEALVHPAIHLHVLSLSLSPTFSPGTRNLSTATFFAPGHRVMRALRSVVANYLQVNVHVDLATTANDSDDDDEPAPRTRHLECTVDLRYTPRLMALAPPPPWCDDGFHVTARKRANRARRAELGLARLRRRIEGACLDPAQAIRRNWFDDHDDAEYWRLRSHTGWVGTSEVEGADDVEDRELIVTFGRVDGVCKAWKLG